MALGSFSAEGGLRRVSGRIMLRGDYLMTAVEIDRRKVEGICRANGISRLLLFGSTARGEAAASSDVDLMVELPAEPTLLDLVRLEREFSSALGKKVDLLTRESISPYIRDSIANDLVVVYEAP
jgi:predicted nucleotidyltransferase